MSKPDLPHDHVEGQDNTGEAVFEPAEIGWLAIEAGSVLLRAGGSVAPVRLDGRTALGRLAGDPRLAALAATCLGAPTDQTRVSVGRAAALRGHRHGRVDLFVVLAGGGPSLAGCVLDDLGQVPAATLILAVGFDQFETTHQRIDHGPRQTGGLWPPSAVVAG